MPFTKNHRTPVQLTGVARGAFDAAYEAFLVSGLLPPVENFTLDYQFQTGSAPLPPAAKYRSFNTESMVNHASSQGQTQAGKLPPTSIRMHVDEYQQLRMYGQDDAIGAKFEQYAERNAQSIAFRIVLAAAQAIQEGKVTLSERGLSMDIDFGRRAELSGTAGVSWANVETSKPLDDLEAMRDVFGKRLATNIISQRTMGYLQRNRDLIAISMQRGTDLPSRISQEDVRAVFRDYGLGEIVIDESVVPDTNGLEVPVFDPDKVILLSGTQIGTTEIGVTAEAFGQENGIPQNEAPGLFSGAIPSDDPSGYDVLVSGILLPVLSAPNDTAVLSI